MPLVSDGILKSHLLFTVYSAHSRPHLILRLVILVFSKASFIHSTNIYLRPVDTTLNQGRVQGSVHSCSGGACVPVRLADTAASCLQ